MCVLQCDVCSSVWCVFFSVMCVLQFCDVCSSVWCVFFSSWPHGSGDWQPSVWQLTVLRCSEPVTVTSTGAAGCRPDWSAQTVTMHLLGGWSPAGHTDRHTATHTPPSLAVAPTAPGRDPALPLCLTWCVWWRRRYSRCERTISVGLCLMCGSTYR